MSSSGRIFSSNSLGPGRTNGLGLRRAEAAAPLALMGPIRLAPECLETIDLAGKKNRRMRIEAVAEQRRSGEIRADEEDRLAANLARLSGGGFASGPFFDGHLQRLSMVRATREVESRARAGGSSTRRWGSREAPPRSHRSSSSRPLSCLPSAARPRCP